MRDFLALLEQHQICTQKAGWLPKTDEEILQECNRRKQFYCALEDSSISDEDVVKLGDGTGAEQLFQPPDAADIAGLRRNLKACPIVFTKAEPPALAVILSHSFWRLRSIAEQGSFILASDYTYRPHASVQELGPDQYLILVGRYLLADIAVIAHIFANIIANTCENSDEFPWQKSTFPIRLLEEYDRSPLHWQLPYKLCSAAEGERYRFAVHLQTSDFIEYITWELFAGAVDFLIGHELAHIVSGHLRSRAMPPTDVPWIYQKAFKSFREKRGKDAEESITLFTSHYLPYLNRELDADALGLLFSAGFGPTGAWDLRLMGAQLAISTIAFTDRVNYIIKKGRDPLTLIGADNYIFPGVVDLLLPKSSHPWGKTRETFLVNSVPYLYKDDFSPAELKRKAALMLVVQDILHIHGGLALQAVHFINSKRGEYVAFLQPDDKDKLFTRYYPPTATADSGHQDTITDASQFYFDLSGQKIILNPNKVKWLIKIRQEEQNIDNVLETQGDLEHAQSTSNQTREMLDDRGNYLFELGSACLTWGNFEEAQNYLIEALEIDKIVKGEKHIDVARDLAQLGRLFHQLGNLEKGRDYFEEALELSREIVGEKHDRTADILNNFGMLLIDRGDLDRGYVQLEKSREIKEGLFGAKGFEIAVILNNLGYLFSARGDTARAHNYCEQALKICEQTPDRDPLLFATVLSNVGAGLLSKGDVDQGYNYTEKALKIRKKILGENHPDIALTLHGVAIALHKKGELKAAKENLEQSLSIYEQIGGEWDIRIALTLSFLGEIFEEQGNFIDAQSHLEQALAIFIRHEEHIKTIKTYKSLGLLLKKQGEMTPSKKYYQMALEKAQQELGEEHSDTADCVNQLGRWFQDSGNLKEARDCFEKSLEIYNRLSRDNDVNRALVQNNLAGVLWEEGNVVGARNLFEQAFIVVERVLGDHHNYTIMILNKLCITSQMQGDWDNAISYGIRLQSFYEQTNSKYQPNSAENLFRLGMILSAKKADLKKAINYLEQALEVDEKLKGNQHPDIAMSLCGIATILIQQENWDDAYKYLKRSLNICEQQLGSTDKTTQQVQQLYLAVKARTTASLS